jgi:demethylmenaquinone methyltransferase / 2-methoxy-6-polyprenyl-1,4-benzoquinol methylase
LYGKEIVAQASLSDRILFREGDVSHFPFADNTFDWAWSADCVGYPAGELTPLLDELMRVVKPGGAVILLGWSSQQLLPGHPLLEARLNATCSGYIPFLKGKSPDSNFMRANHWFREAGLEESKARTFIGADLPL